jgi:hypothetical protein
MFSIGTRAALTLRALSGGMLLVLCAISVPAETASGQIVPAPPAPAQTVQPPSAPAPHPAAAVFEGVRAGLTGGDVSTITPFLAREITMSLRTGEQGTFSAGQASALLEYFLRTRKISNLTFTTIGEQAAVPYATGRATLLYRGTRHLVQVYVAVGQKEGRWQITQLNIY